MAPKDAERYYRVDNVFPLDPLGMVMEHYVHVVNLSKVATALINTDLTIPVDEAPHHEGEVLAMELDHSYVHQEA